MKIELPFLRALCGKKLRCQMAVASAAMLALGFSLPAHAQVSATSETKTEAKATTPARPPAKPARITRAIDENQLTRLTGNVHPLAQAKFERGVVQDSQPVEHMLLLLQRSNEQEAELRQLLEDQLTLDSPKHHGWLTPEEFGAKFGPADADLEATTAWLTAKGFHNIKVGPGRTVIEFSGNAGQVRQAFHTELHRYAVKGEMHIANSSDPQIPAALAPVVAGVVSLHNFPKHANLHRLGKVQRDRETGRLEPLFSFAGCGNPTGNECNGVGPGDFAKIYNIPSSLDGTGQTIAVVGQSNIDLQDVRDYRSIFGLPANDPVIVLNGPDPGLIDDEAEATLDVQVSGGVAPNATVKFVVSETPITSVTSGVDLSALYIIDNNLAGVLSESYGLCEADFGATGNAFFNAMWEQAAAQGITVLVSSGDNGSAGCDNPNNADFAVAGLAVSGIASTPFDVSVGGTDFTYSASSPSSNFWNTTNSGTPPNISAKSYIPEIPWNDSCAFGGINACTAAIINGNADIDVDLVAGSGGPSAVYPKPAWQSGVTGMPADNKRDTPDISLFASNGQNNSFYIVCQRDSTGTNSCDLNDGFTDFVAVGGTSASVQAMAGVMALINQSQATVSNPAPRQGNANYIFYKLYKTHASGVCTSNAAAASNSNCLFYDVTTGNISVACKGGSPNCSNTSTAANQFGILKTGTNTPAWNATAGFDMATGLGSINVANLANVWGSVGLTGTTTAITASPSGAVTHGANASFTVHVSAGAGTPTGQVSLIAKPASAPETGIGPFSLSSGTATISTDMLPGGTAYTVVAHYSGDGTFAQSDSAPVTVTVNKENSHAFVSLVTFDPNTGAIANNDATTAAYGSPYILRVDVTNTANTPCSANLDNGTIPPVNTIPCPTGSVTMTDNGQPFNDFLNTNTGVTSNVAPLNGHGYFEDQPIQLSGGSHSLVAAYSGDNSFNASTSAADGITITKATTTVSISGPTSTDTTQIITLHATVTAAGSGGGPTGTVTFFSGTTNIGTTPVIASPTDPTSFASQPASFSTPGTRTITAVYNGDGNYSASPPSSALSVDVSTGPAGGLYTITATPLTITAGGNAVSTITVTPGLNATPGSVTISCDVTSLAGVTCTPNPLVITVTGATPATGQLTVAVAAPSSTLTAALIPRERLETASMFMSSGRDGNDSSGWRILSGAAMCGALLMFVAAMRAPKQSRAALAAMFGFGFMAIVGFAIGCGGGGGSSGGGGGGGGGGPVATHTSMTVSAAKLPSTMNNFAFTVTVTASGATPTGNVQLFEGTTALGLGVPISNGTAIINTGLGNLGTHSITAHYLGDASTLASMSGALNLTVTGSGQVGLSSNVGNGNVSLTIQ